MSIAVDQASRLRSLMVGGEAVRAGAVRDAARGCAAPAAGVRRGARVVAVASGKGGVGKTNIAVNLAIALAARRLRTVLIDADLGVANADVLCGLSPASRIERVLCERAAGGEGPAAELRSIAVDAPGGFRLVPGSAGVARMADLSTRERQWLVEAMVELEAGCDAVLIDTGAGVGALVRSMVAAADLALVVATPEPTSIADAYALVKAVRGKGEGTALALVVNQAASESEALAVHERIAGVSRRFLGMELPLAGWVAQDPQVAQSVRRRRPFLLEAPGSSAARGMGRLAESVAALASMRAPSAQGRGGASPRNWWSGLLRF